MSEEDEILIALSQAIGQLKYCREHAGAIADRTDNKAWRDTERLIREAWSFAAGAQNQMRGVTPDGR